MTQTLAKFVQFVWPDFPRLPQSLSGNFFYRFIRKKLSEGAITASMQIFARTGSANRSMRPNLLAPSLKAMAVLANAMRATDEFTGCSFSDRVQHKTYRKPRGEGEEAFDASFGAGRSPRFVFAHSNKCRDLVVGEVFLEIKEAHTGREDT